MVILETSHGFPNMYSFFCNSKNWLLFIVFVANLALWPNVRQNKGASQQWGQDNPSFKIVWMRVQEGKPNDWKFLLQMNKLIRRWKCQNGIMVSILLNIKNPIVYQQRYVNALHWPNMNLDFSIYRFVSMHFCFPKVTYIPKLWHFIKKNQVVVCN